MPDLAQRIAAVCREMERGDLPAIAAEIGARDVLDRVLAALTGGADAAALGADLDELDDHLVAYGVAGGLVPPTQRVYKPTPAAAGAFYVAIEVWACPTARCARWQGVDPGAEDGPVCTLQDKPLVRKRINT